MSKLGSFINGLILGVLGGAAIALLMTPKSGVELRDDLRREVDEILEEGRRASEQRQKELERQLNQLRNE